MSEPFLGQIMTVGFNFPPRGWALCDGQLLQISQNTALFSLFGTTYGGDGETTFGLPDLRGRIATHVGTGPGLSGVRWGGSGGNETKVLNVNELPSHTHELPCLAGTGDQSSPAGNFPAASKASGLATVDTPYSATSDSAMGALPAAGGNQAFNIRNPYLGVYHVIALTGIFPSGS